MYKKTGRRRDNYTINMHNGKIKQNNYITIGNNDFMVNTMFMCHCM